jgi:D-sedoheptulose 7-phosphate isomerase
VLALGNKGDILVALSTSGKSPNILRAIEVANNLGLVVIDFPRKGRDVGNIQNNQLKLMHEVCEIVEDYFCDN